MSTIVVMWLKKILIILDTHVIIILDIQMTEVNFGTNNHA